MIDVENTIQVVNLMLQGLGHEPLRLNTNLSPRSVPSPGGDPGGALDLPPIAGDA